MRAAASRARPAPPQADQLGQGLQNPHGQHVGRDQPADRHVLMHDRRRADGRHQHRRQGGQARAGLAESVDQSAALDRAPDRRGLRLLPTPAQRRAEAERFDRRPPAHQLFGQRVAVERGLLLVARSPADRRRRRRRHRDENRDQQGQQQRHRRRGQPDARQEHQGEGQVDGQQHGRPGDRVSDRLDVAQRGAPVGPAPPLDRAQRQAGQPIEGGPRQRHVDPERGRLHRAPARAPQNEVEQDQRDDADGERLQRLEAGMGDHPIVNLQHEQRGRQRQQIDEQRHRREPPEQRLERVAHDGADRLKRRAAVGRRGGDGVAGHLSLIRIAAPSSPARKRRA